MITSIPAQTVYSITALENYDSTAAVGLEYPEPELVRRSSQIGIVVSRFGTLMQQHLQSIFSPAAEILIWYLIPN
jgi:hypothetical protein